MMPMPNVVARPKKAAVLGKPQATMIEMTRLLSAHLT